MIVMEKKLYFLFLEKGCATCAPVFARLDTDKIVDLEQGDGNVEFHVCLSFTNNTTEELFNAFGISGKHTPVLLYPDGHAEDDVDSIIGEMNNLGVSTIPER